MRSRARATQGEKTEPLTHPSLLFPLPSPQLLHEPAARVGLLRGHLRPAGRTRRLLLEHRGALRKEHRRPLRSIVRMVLANAVFGAMTPNIDSAAHLGGLCAGAAAVLLLGPSFSVEDRKLVDKPLLPIFASKPLSLK